MNRRAAFAIPAFLLLAACSTPAPRTEMAVMPPANLAPPGRVLVSGFTGASRATQDAIVTALVRDIGRMGLPADRVGPGGRPEVRPQPGDLIVDGTLAPRAASADVTIAIVRGQPAPPVVLKTLENETVSVRRGGRPSAEALGHRIAADLGAFFAQEGWIARELAPVRSAP